MRSPPATSMIGREELLPCVTMDGWGSSSMRSPPATSIATYGHGVAFSKLYYVKIVLVGEKKKKRKKVKLKEKRKWKIIFLFILFFSVL